MKSGAFPIDLARAAVAVLLLFAVPARAGEIRGVCDIRFRAASTLHDFSGTVRSLPFSASMEGGPGGPTVIPSVAVEVPVEGIDTGNGDRNVQMRDMFQSGRYPRIHGVVRNVDIEGIRKGIAKGGRAVLDLALRIRGVERAIPATVTSLQERGNRVEFDVEFPVSLKAFGLQPPTVFFFIRVHDRVDVKGNVRLEVSP